jgi:hypothetical protein
MNGTLFGTFLPDFSPGAHFSKILDQLRRIFFDRNFLTFLNQSISLRFI